jgi:hypothetical protein
MLHADPVHTAGGVRRTRRERAVAPRLTRPTDGAVLGRVLLAARTAVIGDGCCARGAVRGRSQDHIGPNRRTKRHRSNEEAHGDEGTSHARTSMRRDRETRNRPAAAIKATAASRWVGVPSRPQEPGDTEVGSFGRGSDGGMSAFATDARRYTAMQRPKHATDKTRAGVWRMLRSYHRDVGGVELRAPIARSRRATTGTGNLGP